MEGSLGAAHPAVAGLINKLAAMYTAQARYKEADPLYRRSIQIFTSALGPEHIDVAIAIADFAEMLRVAGLPSESAEARAHARAIPVSYTQMTMPPILLV